MKAQMVFKRYELKYLLTIEEYLCLRETMKQYMELDQFGRHTIHNVYYDTKDFLLIRRSIEKPCYKEKLRVRSYGNGTAESKVFVELKKKYDGVVYKRRLELKKKEAFDFLSGKAPLEEQTQISKEVDYFMKFYKNLEPMVYLSYEREAFFGKEDPDFRMTFDHNIRMKEWAEHDNEKVKSNKIVKENMVLLEIKTGMGIPVWLVDFFSKYQIYKTSFSKYGTAYQKFLLPKIFQNGRENLLETKFTRKQEIENTSNKGGKVYVA